MIGYVKAHACGNDFLIVEARTVPEEKHREIAIRLCARHSGVGADGVEYLEWTGERSGRIRLFNSDGSVAEISGNGTRCVAAWMAHQKNATPGENFSVETDAGVRQCRLVERTGYSYEFIAEMGVPMVAAGVVALEDGSRVPGVIVSTGNPHFVVFVDNDDFAVNGASWPDLGERICRHSQFPGQTNVEFVRIVSPDEIEIRIYERGAGPTSSSGTGTCATAAATIAMHGGRPNLRVKAPGGMQRVSWKCAGEAIWLTGPAELISIGEAF